MEQKVLQEVQFLLCFLVIKILKLLMIISKEKRPFKEHLKIHNLNN